MAVVKNFWLRDNAQKLGGAVIYQAKGQTYMRQLAPSVSNPRTTAQMTTRVRLANLVAFYRASAAWMRGAFETKAANQSDYNAFVSANAAANRVWLTKSQVDAGNAIVAPYIVSRGSLGEIEQTALAGAVATNLYTGELAIGASTTIGQLATALIAANNGIQSGDQLSVIQYIQNTSTDGNFTIVCRPYEVILTPDSTALLSLYIPLDLLTIATDGAAALAVNTSAFVGGAAVLLSRTQGGRTLVSSSVVTLTSGNTVYPALTTAAHQAEAISSYGSTTAAFLDSNAADTTGGSVPTAANVLSLSIGGTAFAAGATIPNSVTGSTNISIQLSAPIEVSSGISATLRTPPSTSVGTISFSTSAGTATDTLAGTLSGYDWGSNSAGSHDTTLSIVNGDETITARFVAVSEGALE